ncbi:MAG: 3,5-cyclic-AMP phosphodiesterase [Sphingomonadales bacterium]|jgi:3',5'-cyclic AMP phosphodiesterase CpdA|nr:3,5-cyclic-AMP phosphodiesterase [Sphingomonadales bacterium]
MLIAQITDIHLGFDRDDPAEPNRQRLDAVLEALVQTAPRPDLLLATGDLVEDGFDGISYARLRDALVDLPFPVRFALGNHDSRQDFLRWFPEAETAEGFVQYAIEEGPIRILVLDTLEEGRHGGGFCETRAAWLRARLEEEPERPTLIALHHPPIESGLSWMGENGDAPWILRLWEVVAEAQNVVALIAGHLHRPVMTQWAGTALAVCPSTAPQVALDLLPIDPERPDGRAMIVADPPWFGLHLWTGAGLVSHFDTAGGHDVIASYGPELQPLVRMLAREREG